VFSDQLGSPRVLVNASSGAVAGMLRHDAWGVVLEDSVSTLLPFGFAGGLYDAETGLVRFGARDYDPTIGRWVSKDPSRFADGTNQYIYVHNDPVNFLDLTGNNSVAAGVLVGAGVGAAVGGLPGAVIGALGGALLGLGVVSVPGDTPVPDSGVRDRDRTKDCAAGLNCKGPPGPKSKGICELERDLEDCGTGMHFCQYYCPQDGSRPTLPFPNSLSCPNPIAFGSGG
jgi:RHS repeat-associated protein